MHELRRTCRLWLASFLAPGGPVTAAASGTAPAATIHGGAAHGFRADVSASPPPKTVSPLVKKIIEWGKINDEKEAKDLSKEWERLGKPKPDNKGRRRQDGSADPSLLGMLVPWWLTPSELGCSDMSERCIEERERREKERQENCP